MKTGVVSPTHARLKQPFTRLNALAKAGTGARIR